MPPLNGSICLDKPSGHTSAYLVKAVKHMLPRGVKVGHAGTLDRFATGVLVILVGTATRTSEAVMNGAKSYEATIRLGATTPTHDPESVVSVRGDAVEPSRDEINRVLATFVGDTQQVPPVFSALKIGGRRASDLTRSGKELALEPRLVRISRIDLMSYEWPFARIAVDCGRGTYIRSIARDIGEKLGVGGFVSALRRTRVGDFHIGNSVTLDALRQGGVERYLIQPAATVGHT